MGPSPAGQEPDRATTRRVSTRERKRRIVYSDESDDEDDYVYGCWPVSFASCTDGLSRPEPVSLKIRVSTRLTKPAKKDSKYREVRDHQRPPARAPSAHHLQPKADEDDAVSTPSKSEDDLDEDSTSAQYGAVPSLDDDEVCTASVCHHSKRLLTSFPVETDRPDSFAPRR